MSNISITVCNCYASAFLLDFFSICPCPYPNHSAYVATLTELHGIKIAMNFNIQIICRFQKSKQKVPPHRVLQTTQMKLILLCVWADLAVLSSTKTALKFKYEIQIS